jgi:hypothetical protein
MAASTSIFSEDSPILLLRTAIAAVEGFNKFTTEDIIAPFAPTATHQLLPLSLGRPVWSNDGYLEYLKPILAEFQNFRLVLLDAVEDQTRNKVVLHAASRADTPIGEYRNEYLAIIQMTDDHRQIVSERIFSDASVVTGFLAEFRNYMVDKAKEAAS